VSDVASPMPVVNTLVTQNPTVTSGTLRSWPLGLDVNG
jgi:hypothetical protein